MSERLEIIRTVDGLDRLKEVLQAAEYIAYDTETTGLDKDDQIIGFSFAVDAETGYYVILSYWDTTAECLVDLETKASAGSVLGYLIGKKLIMQNGLFDCKMTLSNFGIDLLPHLHTDSMILAHLTNENRACGLKELGVALFGEDARKEQLEMRESVYKNGGVLTKASYELYKADADLLAKYGAKDAVLTMKVFYALIPDLFEQNLDTFFYDDESMPLLRGPTNDLNNTGLRVDAEKLQSLRDTLEAECLEAQGFIESETAKYTKDKYPGTGKTNHFNIGSSHQMAWLLFERLENPFHLLTKGGKALCKALNLRLPYTLAAKRDFVAAVNLHKGRIWQEATVNPKTKRIGRPKKVGEYWTYLSTGKDTMKMYSLKYRWVEKFLEYKRAEKLLGTYVMGIQTKMKYNIIRPEFKQHGTTSGRYSSKAPNFQNLPRDDKRLKSCIVARPGKVFVGADFSQLEPRVFASLSKDERLLKCFKDGDDFYSVIGAPVFGKLDCTMRKDGSPNSFAVKYDKLRHAAKVLALAVPYGTTPPQLSSEMLNKANQIKTMDECREIINDYFANYPSVKQLMLNQHEQAKQHGVVYSLFGRPRRIPEAKAIPRLYGKDTPHEDLPREARNLLNLAMNHPIQSTGASIMNRASIAFYRRCRELEAQDAGWQDVRIVLQVHDQLVLEGPEHLAEQMVVELRAAMQNTTQLPGVDLIAEPTISKDLAGQK